MTQLPPIPSQAQPLGYYPPAEESLLPFIRMLALTAIVFASLQLLYSACQIVMPYASGGRVSMGMSFSLTSPNLIVALLLELVCDAAAVLVLIGGVGCQSLRPAARTMTVAAALVMVGGYMLQWLFRTMTLFTTGSFWASMPAHGKAIYVLSMAVSLLKGQLLPLLLVWALTRASVRQQFQFIGAATY